jgi:hypothetical protein
LKEQNKVAHIQLKSGRFYNGYITEIGSDFIYIDDLKLGVMPVFFLEVEVIETFKLPDKKKEEVK